MKHLLWMSVKKHSWRRFVFWIKAVCDTYLYGDIIMPPGRYCQKCGSPIVKGEIVSYPFHTACVGE